MQLKISKWKLHFVCEKKICKIWWAPVCFVIEFYTNFNFYCSRSKSTSQHRACCIEFFFVKEKSKWKLLYFWHDCCWLVCAEYSMQFNQKFNLFRCEFQMHSKKQKNEINWITHLLPDHMATWICFYSNKHTSTLFDRVEVCKKKLVPEQKTNT